ncbi:uncharacterized protein ATNIH1004_009221 [Aspergillus tanneri]|uniref:Proline racemase n=1 Tax=Aspergillus tanneri TaxID=1220188 RepID=A0A5M9MI13_9EURO|nr:uncharacterized protein ATNIH1004_009221 [Aspergillus tanneri]KAA8645010.1 hypothetical protein ATNIH1004_009221 [Aspergillus tanneri]
MAAQSNPPRIISIVGAYAEGDTGDVVTGGVLDVKGKNSMFEKMEYFREHKDELRKLLIYEPRGRPTMFINVLLPPCAPEADAGFIIIGSEKYPPMSGSNLTCVVTVLIETGMIPFKKGDRPLKLDTPAGLITATAHCDDRKCTSVSFENVPSFSFGEYNIQFRHKLVNVDIAYGGVIYAMVDARTISAILDDNHANE